MEKAGGKRSWNPGVDPQDQQPAEEAHHQAGAHHWEGHEVWGSGQGMLCKSILTDKCHTEIKQYPKST